MGYPKLKHLALLEVSLLFLLNMVFVLSEARIFVLSEARDLHRSLEKVLSHQKKSTVDLHRLQDSGPSAVIVTV